LVNPMMVSRVRQRYGLRPRYQRLRDRGLLTMAEAARALGLCSATVKVWRRAGLLRAHPYDDKPQYLFEPPGADVPRRYTWKGLSFRRLAKKWTRSTGPDGYRTSTWPKSC